MLSKFSEAKLQNIKKERFSNFKIKQRANSVVIILLVLMFQVHNLTHFQNNYFITRALALCFTLN